MKVQRPFYVVPFEPSHQEGARFVAEELLCRELAVQSDLSGDEDLEDVARTYAPPGNLFLVALVDGAVVATAGLLRISDRDGELHRLYVLAAYRRQGIASALVGRLLTFVKSRGHHRILLEIRPEMKDTLEGYWRYGFVPESESLPRPGAFLAIRF